MEERERSARVRVLEEEVFWSATRVLRVERMRESGLRRFLKGRVLVSPSESELESSRRRFFFFLSAAIVERERVCGEEEEDSTRIL